MPRRSHSFVDDLFDLAAALPWWAGIALAALAYLVFHGLAAIEVPRASGLQDTGPVLLGHITATVARFAQYLVPLILAAGAVASIIKGRKREGLVSAARASGSTAISEMSWRELELLVGQAYREQGFKAQETGSAAGDGGVDLVLTRERQRVLVQCKHWKAWKVGVQTVREVYATLTADGAGLAILITSGGFTAEALRFAQGKLLELIDGKGLQQLLGGTVSPRTTAPNMGPPKPGSSAHGNALRIALFLILILAFLGILFGLFQSVMEKVRSDTEAKARQAQAQIASKSGTSSFRTQPPAQTSTWRSPTISPEQAARQALETAFEAQYVAPTGCDDWKSHEHMVECVNHRMRAHSAFLAAQKTSSHAE